jgi:hypothetical protein
MVFNICFQIFVVIHKHSSFLLVVTCVCALNNIFSYSGLKAIHMGNRIQHGIMDYHFHMNLMEFFGKDSFTNLSTFLRYFVVLYAGLLYSFIPLYHPDIH